MDRLTLETMAGGAVLEAFDIALARIVENINDPNTEAKKARGIELKVAFKPNEERNFSDITFQVVPKLAPDKPVELHAHIAKEGGKLVMLEMGAIRPDQHELPGNVVNLKK